MPAGAVTGIGSLPIADPGEAVDFVVSCSPRLPFCPQPQLVHLAEDTLAQLNGRDEVQGTWLEQFAHAVLAGAFPQAIGVKTQLTGPVTLAGLLSVRKGRVASHELIVSVAEVVAQNAEAQVRRLRPLGLPIVVYVDEPALALVEPADLEGAAHLLNSIFGRIVRAGGRAGIHCCSVSSPSPLAAMSATVLSFDATTDAASDGGSEILRDSERLISFGLIAPSSSERPGSAFSRWLAAASRTGDPSDVARRTIVTTSCGLGEYTLAEAENAFRSATQVAELVEQLAARIATANSPDAADESRGYPGV
jgi:methionine synthase II (cobalamin-independent)